MKITTNNHWRNFRYSYEVPEKVFAEFDWLSEDESIDGWISYKGQWLHLSQFMRGEYRTTDMRREDGDAMLRNWHGYCPDTYFSGVLIRVSEDGEQYQIATYRS